LEFCGASCYKQHTVGRDAVDWGAHEVLSWLTQEGQLPHGRARSLCAENAVDGGHALLTNLTEGRLRRAGMPRGRARAVVDRIEDLRQGAWLQPEPPRAELGLETVAETGRRAGAAWRSVLQDDKHRSFAAWCPSAVDKATAWRWFETLRDCLPWQDLTDTRYQSDGRVIPRRTLFVVDKGCRCTYRYSGVVVPPCEEPDFMAEIRRRCTAVAGLSSQPNACNVNLYRNGQDSVGWHTDNEELYEAEYNDAIILSLTLGAGRKFMIRQMDQNGKRAKPSVLVLSHGDLCTMEGRMQRYYLHAVPKEPRISEPRINLTWRWITKHSTGDGCPLHGPGN